MTKAPIFRAPAMTACLGLLACEQRYDLSPETLGLAVRDAGFPCESVVDAGALDEDSWRIACGGGLTYLASVLDTGDICVEPLQVGDLGVGPIENLTENRCAPDVKAR